jgi:8-oxo-dGTP diphosphatase
MDHGRYCYDYPRPAVSADIVVFGFDGQNLKMLLITRGQEPYKDNWALPGGLLEINETIEGCALRELYEETAIKDAKLEQLHTFSALNRDPRGRVITIAFWTIIKMNHELILAGDDASNADWFNINSLPLLAFDHLEIVNMAIEELKSLNSSNLNEVCKRFAIHSSIDHQAFQDSLSTLTLI